MKKWIEVKGTFVGSPRGSGYISVFSFSGWNRLDKFLAESVISFTNSTVEKSLRDDQKYAWAIADEADRSHNSLCSITWPLIWFKVNWELTLTITSPAIAATNDLGFPFNVHLMFNKLVDDIDISCTPCNNQDIVVNTSDISWIETKLVCLKARKQLIFYFSLKIIKDHAKKNKVKQKVEY